MSDTSNTDYNCRLIQINNLSDGYRELKQIGVDPTGIELMLPKTVGCVIKLEKVSCTAANILKQEMLSLGGDAAVSRDVITHRTELSDVLLLGNLKQLQQLIKKLSAQPFGLSQIAETVKKIVDSSVSGSHIVLDCREYQLELSARTHIMGVLNVTPDSFSDGGLYTTVQSAVAHAHQMVEDGVDIIDIGGESTRPGATPVSLDKELQRVIPVVERLTSELSVPISVDTYKSEVARQALSSGAHIINDISALRFDPQMKYVVAEFDVPVVLMHIKGTPRNMQLSPHYDDLLSEISGYLRESIQLATAAGVKEEKIIIDPGIGFGKTVEHNLTILKRLREFCTIGRPILIGPSRKSFIGKILDLPVNLRIEGTAAAVAVAIMNGANIVRVHDTKQMVRVVKIVDAILSAKSDEPIEGSTTKL